jgi:sec-independent protein translocase protein TatB
MDNFLGIGGSELIVIVLLATIVLGPERMMRAAREIGKLVRNIKAYASSLSSELKAELDILDELEKVKKDLTR